MGNDINKTISPSERMAICKKCPELWKGKICKKCGCVMKLKVKIEMAKCPIGKW